jgi:hypothetical protein
MLGRLLLGATDRAIGLVDRFAACFADGRAPERIEHEVATLVGQRVFGIALGYEDVSDHDHLRHDPVMAVLAGKLAARRSDCAPPAGKSTLNRLELSRPQPTRYHKIAHDPAAVERLFVDIFMEAHKRAPELIILDLDAHRRSGPRAPGGAVRCDIALRDLRGISNGRTDASTSPRLWPRIVGGRANRAIHQDTPESTVRP